MRKSIPVKVQQRSTHTMLNVSPDLGAVSSSPPVREMIVNQRAGTLVQTDGTLPKQEAHFAAKILA